MRMVNPVSVEHEELLWRSSWQDSISSLPTKYEDIYDLRSQGCDQGQDHEVRGVGRVGGSVSGSEKGRGPSP
jgi:hypothetical protein